MAVLHFIYDPLCGWCYGAERLVQAAEGVAGLELRLHGGGLWPEPTGLPEDMRSYIQQADGRIAEMTGLPFGRAYLEGLLLDPTMVLHSRPTIAAVLAAEALAPGEGPAMLRSIQHAHYEDGRRVVEEEVLCDAAARIGLDREAFAAALASAPVDEHIRQTRQLMSAVGARGFPAFVLEVEQGLHGVPHHRFASSPQAFADWLRKAIDEHSGMPVSAR